MKTKIGLPLGLALVMFIGVFTTMLALGALNPQPAEAQGKGEPATIVSEGLEVVRSDNQIDAYADWTITATNDDTEIAVGAEIDLKFTDHNVGNKDDCTGDTDNDVCAAGSWKITVPASGTDPAIGPSQPKSVQITDLHSVQIVTATAIPADRIFKIEFLATKRGDGTSTGGIQNPKLADGHIITVANGKTDKVTTTLPMATIAADGLKVERSDDAASAYATWTITAKNDSKVITKIDRITIKFTAHDVGENCTKGETDVCTANNWKITVPASGTDPAITNLKIDSVATTKITATVMLLIDDNIPAGRTFVVTYTPAEDKPVPGIQNPANADDGRSIIVAGREVTIASFGPLPDVTVKASPISPGAAAEYTIEFTTNAVLRAGGDQIILNIDSSVGVPTSLSPSDVRIRASKIDGAKKDDSGKVDARPNQNRSLEDAPVYSVIPGTDNRKQYKIRIPNMDAVPENPVADIAAGATVTLTLLSTSGFTNPTEAGKDDFTVSTTRQTTPGKATFETPVQLFSDDLADNRDKPLTVTGKGFKNGTTATVYLDQNQNGMKDTGDTDLISVPVGADDTFTATFNVTVPPFETLPGVNVINAFDGEAPPNTLKWVGSGVTAAKAAGAPIFTVEGLMTVTPKTLGIGDTLTISLKDWPNEQIDELVIGDQNHLLNRSLSVNNNVLQFDIKVLNSVGLGTQQVEIASSDERDTTNVLISGADLIVNPSAAVPNQTLSVTGRGFSDGATINESGEVTTTGHSSSEVSFGGRAIKTGTSRSNKINDNETVTVDNGGNWAASIVVPVTDASTSPGPHILKVVDSAGRTGVAEVTIAERTLTLSPAEGRVGTEVTLTGTGFPARNLATGAESSQVVTIEYDGDFVHSVNPDASGSFATTFRVPLGASIPSTNSVRATFRYPGTGDVHTLTTHQIPEGVITLSAAEAMPGDTITITGQGFKAFTTLGMIEIGSIEVTPAPKPSTATDGTFTAAVLVPALDLGLKNLRVTIGGETSGIVASASLIIVEESAAPMMPAVMMSEEEAPAVAFAPVIAEDNLVKVFHFDAATQNEAPNYGWTIYDVRPLFMKTNTLSMITPGGIYFLKVKNDQMGVEIGGRTMDLYAGINLVQW